MGSLHKKIIGSISIAALVAGGLVVAPGIAQAGVGSTPRVLINEVYGGGGNSGATYTRDFIELYNGTDAAVDLAGWSVQYASASGASWQITPLTGTIAAGYLLPGRRGRRIRRDNADRAGCRGQHSPERNVRQGRAR